MQKIKADYDKKIAEFHELFSTEKGDNEVNVFKINRLITDAICEIAAEFKLKTNCVNVSYTDKYREIDFAIGDDLDEEHRMVGGATYYWARMSLVKSTILNISYKICPDGINGSEDDYEKMEIKELVWDKLVLIFRNVLYRAIVVKKELTGKDDTFTEEKTIDVKQVEVKLENKESASDHYDFLIINNTDEEKTAVLLGHNKYIDLENCGSDDGITIVCPIPETTYKEALREIALNPFNSNLILLSSENQNQLINPIRIDWKSTTGRGGFKTIFTKEFYKEEQEDKTINEIKFSFIVNGGTSLKTVILPKTELKISIFVEKPATWPYLATWPYPPRPFK
jgi:hypothetical protein